MFLLVGSSYGIVSKSSRQITKENEVKGISISGMFQIHPVVLSQNLRYRFSTLMENTLCELRVTLASTDMVSRTLKFYLFQFWLYLQQSSSDNQNCCNISQRNNGEETWEKNNMQGLCKKNSNVKSWFLYVQIASQNILSSTCLPRSHSEAPMPGLWHNWQEKMQNLECPHPCGNSYSLAVNNSYIAPPSLAPLRSTGPSCPMKMLRRFTILVRCSATPAASHRTGKVKKKPAAPENFAFTFLSRLLCCSDSFLPPPNSALGIEHNWWGVQQNRSRDNRAAVMAVLEDASRHICIRSA